MVVGSNADTLTGGNVELERILEFLLIFSNIANFEE